MNVSDPLWLQAEVLDLQRRIDVLESLLFGNSQETPDPKSLVPLYIDACRGPVDSEVAARLWERQIYLLDARTLLIMARIVRDPVPWQPFLYLLDLYVEQGYAMKPVRDHLLKVAQDLLNMQGFEKIQPRDLMANPLRVKTAIATMRRSTNG